MPEEWGASQTAAWTEESESEADILRDRMSLNSKPAQAEIFLSVFFSMSTFPQATFVMNNYLSHIWITYCQEYYSGFGC